MEHVDFFSQQNIPVFICIGFGVWFLLELRKKPHRRAGFVTWLLKWVHILYYWFDVIPFLFGLEEVGVCPHCKFNIPEKATVCPIFTKDV